MDRRWPGTLLPGQGSCAGACRAPPPRTKPQEALGWGESEPYSVQRRAAGIPGSASTCFQPWSTPPTSRECPGAARAKDHRLGGLKAGEGVGGRLLRRLWGASVLPASPRCWPCSGLGVPGCGRFPPTPPSAFSPLRLCLSSSVSFRDTLMGFRATLIQDDFSAILTLIPSVRPFSQTRAQAEAPGGHELGGHFPTRCPLRLSGRRGLPSSLGAPQVSGLPPPSHDLAPRGRPGTAPFSPFATPAALVSLREVLRSPGS